MHHGRVSGVATVAEGLEVGDLVGGKYRVCRLLGRGGMGCVFEAVHEAVGKPVALKWVRAASAADAHARIDREARTAARVHHANVVDIYDVIEHGGVTCIVMELVRGEPLSARLARDPRLAVAEAVAIAVEVARGLAAAHRAGVVHRDLKPANLMLREPGAGVRVTMVDFGISRVEAPIDGATTGSGGVAGTPQYMAPEQVRGERVGAPADVYALGTVLYEMLTGRPPHVRDPISALLVEIATVAPTPAHLLRPDLPVGLSDVIGRSLAKRPHERYRSAEDFEHALLPFLPAPAVLDAPRGETPTADRTRPALDVPTGASLDVPTRAPTVATSAAPSPDLARRLGPAPSGASGRGGWRVAMGASIFIVLAITLVAGGVGVASLAGAAAAGEESRSGSPPGAPLGPAEPPAALAVLADDAPPTEEAPAEGTTALADAPPTSEATHARAATSAPEVDAAGGRRTLRARASGAQTVRRARGFLTGGVSSDEF